MEAEQKFLARFPEDYIRQVNVARCADYEEYYINPCRVMLRHVLCCMLADIPADKIRFGEEDYMRLKEEVQNQDRGGLKRSTVRMRNCLDIWNMIWQTWLLNFKIGFGSKQAGTKARA